MGIFAFTKDQALGEVRSIETSKVSVRVTDGRRLQKARVGRLVAIQSTGDEWLIGIVERVWRRPVEAVPLEDVEAHDPAQDEEENGIAISLVGTYRERDGEDRDIFSRAIFSMPEINRPVYPIEERCLEDFMGILSDSAAENAKIPLKLGKYALDNR